MHRLVRSWEASGPSHFDQAVIVRKQILGLSTFEGLRPVNGSAHKPPGGYPSAQDRSQDSITVSSRVGRTVRPLRTAERNPPVPGEQFVETVLRDVGDTGEHIGEPDPGIDVVEFCSGEEAKHEGGALPVAARCAKARPNRSRFQDRRCAFE